MSMSEFNETSGTWTLLTGHGHVLVEITRNPEARIRDIAAAAGLTERAVQAIVADLEAAGYLTRTRVGRRSRYTVNPDSPFRHRAQAGLRIGPFLDMLTAMAESRALTPSDKPPESARQPGAPQREGDPRARLVTGDATGSHTRPLLRHNRPGPRRTRVQPKIGTVHGPGPVH